MNVVRLLLDEDVDVNLRHEFSDEFQVETVSYRGWKGLPNGKLLDAAAEEFDVLITMDNSLPEQRNLAEYDLSVVILRAASKDLADLRELVPRVESVLPDLAPGEAHRVYPAPA